MNGETHVNPETRFNRGAWLTLVLAIVMLLYGSVVLVYRFSLPTDGWNVNEASELPGQNYTQNLMGYSSGLRPGDRVIALEGFETDWLNVTPSLVDAWQVGATIDYTVIREGKEIHLPVTLGRWQFGKWLLNSLRDPIELAAILPGFLLVILSFFVFLRRPSNPAAQAFLLFNAAFIATDLVGATLPTGWPEKIDPAANTLSVWMSTVFLILVLPSVLIHFALVFPHPKPILRRFPWLSLVPLGIGMTIEVLTHRTGNTLGWYWFVFSLLFTVGILVHNAVTMRDAVSRAQIRWGLGGLIFNFGLVALAITASTLGLLPLTPQTFDTFFALVSAIGGTVMGISLVIAITRYRLFDIDIIIRKTLVYSLLTGLLGLVYFGGVALLQGILTADSVGYNGGLPTAGEHAVSGPPAAVVLVLTTLIIAALFNPLRRRLQETIDRRFYRQKYDAEKALAEFAAAARSQADLELLMDTLTQTTINTLHPKQHSLWMIKK